MKSKTAIIPKVQPVDIAILNNIMNQAGQAANEVAASHAFDDHTARKAENTIRRKRADLALFETFLNDAGVPAAGLYDHPEAWRNVTWGLVETFKKWQLDKGYAIASINGHLSTVRTFAKLAHKAGTEDNPIISDTEARMIATVQGYSHKEGKHLDDKRRADGTPTRVGHKKAESVNIPEDIAQAMVQPGTTAQSRRDAFIMCLLLEHGLRVSEIAILTNKTFDMKTGTFTFYRPKVDIIQTHTMTPNTRRAASSYINQDAPVEGILWRRSCKGSGKLSTQLSEISATRAITKRVELIGRKHGIEGLSAHDGRHYAALYESNNQTTIKRLMDMFGWASPAMAIRYIKSAEIANAGTARVKAS